jgi:hypothetical protein
MIRRAVTEDRAAILLMGERFHGYSPWRDVEFDRDAVGVFVDGLLISGAIFLHDDGMCGGIISPPYFNPAFALAVEFFWYAPTGDKGLRAAFEAWAREGGALGVQFSALADDHLPAVSRLYRRAGFIPAETAFVKRF